MQKCLYDANSLLPCLIQVAVNDGMAERMLERDLVRSFIDTRLKRFLCFGTAALQPPLKLIN